MKSLLTSVETRHREVLGEIVDTSRAGEVIRLLQKLVTRGSLPFVSFQKSKTAHA